MSGRPRHHEPALWALFGAGGFLAALLLPGVVLVVGVLGPLGLLPREPLVWMTASPTGRLALAVGLPLLAWHAAHRVFHGLHDLQLPRGAAARAGTYGVAALLSVVVWGTLLLL